MWRSCDCSCDLFDGYGASVGAGVGNGSCCSGGGTSGGRFVPMIKVSPEFGVGGVGDIISGGGFLPMMSESWVG